MRDWPTGAASTWRSPKVSFRASQLRTTPTFAKLNTTLRSPLAAKSISKLMVSRSWDLQRALVLGAFAEPHAHLDKAFTAELVPNPSGDLDGAIQAWSVAAAAGLFDYANTVTRAVSAMQALVRNGVLHVRTHVNVGACTAASGITAVREAAAMLDGIIDVQTVALTVSPIIGNGAEARANRAALDAAVSAGADLVGGCPHLEPNDKGNKMIDHAIDVATEAGIGIDLHVDETLDSGVFFLPVLARAVMDRGFGPSRRSESLRYPRNAAAVRADRSGGACGTGRHQRVSASPDQFVPTGPRSPVRNTTGHYRRRCFARSRCRSCRRWRQRAGPVQSGWAQRPT